MRLWRAVSLVNLALALGVAWGYVVWGTRAARLEGELARVRSGAADGAGDTLPVTLPGGERQWRVRGVVRAVLPELQVVVVSHDDIPGYMPAMTMGFRVASAAMLRDVAIGDAVRFTLRGRPPDLVVTAIEKTP